jgi:cobalamin biosynthesis protein CobD/CbiB
METSLQPHGEDQETIVQLIRGILKDTLALFTKELTAARLEIKQEVTKALASGVSLAIGGFILAVGFVLLSLMFVLILASYSSLPLWASLGIVAVVYFILGGVVMWAGAHRAREVKPLPQQSIESTKQDVRYITGRRTDHSQTAEKAL